jgi:hypothetical protein
LRHSGFRESNEEAVAVSRQEMQMHWSTVLGHWEWDQKGMERLRENLLGMGSGGGEFHNKILLFRLQDGW